MKYEIKGEPTPVVICELSAGESMITEKGSMVWMSPNTVSYTHLLLPRFQAEYPNLKIHLLEASSAQLEQALHEGKADLIIGFAPKDPLQITAQKAWKEEYGILAPKDVYKRQLV